MKDLHLVYVISFVILSVIDVHSYESYITRLVVWADKSNVHNMLNLVTSNNIGNKFDHSLTPPFIIQAFWVQLALFYDWEWNLDQQLLKWGSSHPFIYNLTCLQIFYPLVSFLSWMVDSESSSMATVIEGTSVGIALEESNRLVFLELCQYCRAVVCCRVSPIQKAQVHVVHLWQLWSDYVPPWGVHILK